MRSAILRVACLVGIGLAMPGCSTNRWAREFEAVGDAQYPVVADAAITFEQVSYADLERDKSLPGFQIIGVSQFRGPIQKARPGTRDSGLRKHAARVGAEYVRWAEAPIGTVGAGYVNRGAGLVASVPRTDYLAVYYRRVSRHGELRGSTVMARKQRPKGSGTLYRRTPRGPWIARWVRSQRSSPGNIDADNRQGGGPNGSWRSGVADAAIRRDGVIDAAQDRYIEESRKTLAQHFAEHDEYLRVHINRKTGFPATAPSTARTARGHLKTVANALEWSKLDDLDRSEARSVAGRAG